MFYMRQEPYVDEFREYILPSLCHDKIEEICNDILKRGLKTRWEYVYDAIYQMIEEEVTEEYLNREANHDISST